MDKRVSHRMSIQAFIKNGRQRKALINPTDDLNLVSQNTGLALEKIKQIKMAFQHHSHQTGILPQEKVFDVLVESELQMESLYREKVLQEIENFQKDGNKIDLLLVCNVYVAMVDVIRCDQEEANNAEYVDAFVAMGGNTDRTGVVKRTTIIEMIKVTFELTFDIEEFMEKQNVGNEDLDFTQFCTLFDQQMFESRSIISGISRKYRENNQDIEQMIRASIENKEYINAEDDDDMFQEKPFEVNYNDFQKWLRKEEKSII